MLTLRRRCSRLMFGMIALCALMIPSVSVLGQTIKGSISGTVTDSTNRVVVGATVMLVSNQTGNARSVTTGEDGRFGFGAVHPGAYTIKVEQSGFQTLERKGVILSA
ncbi:MAG: carboxypeptidase-like regulatory domain-containing protein, partial [Pyrinomonadaceae bacterium]|nr:carboxypeptidase-like regulatory domain-containing protein [Pyrinomonadaceae bacterium]